MQHRNSKPFTQKEENQVSQVVFNYLTYWPLFLIFLFLSFGAAFLYLRYTVPLYEASAKLLIKDDKKGTENSKLLEEINQISTKKIIENETEVLQSRPIMDSVVTKLRLYAPVSQEGKITPISAYVLSPIIIEAQKPGAVNKSGKVNFKYDAATGTVVLNNSFSGPINEWLNTPYGVLKFLPNPKYRPSSNNRPFFFNLVPVNSITSGILSSLKVTVGNRLTSVIDLSYKNEVPQKAEDILNTLLYYYNLAAVNEKSILARNSLASINQRLSIVGNDLDSIEKKMQQFKTAHNAPDLGTQSTLYLQNVSASDSKLGEVSAQLSGLNQLEKFVASAENSAGVLPSVAGVNDPTLTQLMSNLNERQLEYEKLKKTVAENNPILLSLKDQINKLKPDILSNIQNQRKNLEFSRNNLSSSSGKYNSMLSVIPQQEKQLLEISREQNIKSSIYQFLLQKREESELSYASTISDSRVVNYAQATKNPVFPNNIMIYVAALLVGISLPIVVITARESLSRKILYRKEVEELTAIPVIGELAFNKTKNPLVVEAGKRTFIAEEFRKIRVSLLYLGIDSVHKKRILVTSSIPGEGKSFIAANLAISLALTGKKVVLVDIDLHNPSLGRIFKRDDEFGVSDYLIGEKTQEEIIYKVPDISNLSFISAGTLQEGPSELLVNGKIQKFISDLESNFDFVIMDTAPVVYVTDAYLLTTFADATLYVIRHKHTPKMIVKRIDETNKINPLNNPAIIFNGVKARGYFKNNYGYGYDYVYGNKKLHDKKTKKTNA